MTGLGVAPPPVGGIDFDVPGDDVRLAATRWPGTGTPVVLLHGLSSQRRFWNLAVPHLRGGPDGDLPLLALDLRGHGDSDRPASSSYELSAVAADLAIAMDAIGWSRAVVVGHSWGGSVAATFAAEHPERALAFVGIDGGFTSPTAFGTDRAEIRKRLEPPRLAMPTDELVAMMSSHAPGGAWTDDVASAVLPIFEVGADGLARARLPYDIHMRIVDTLLEYDAVRTLAQVRCPTWLIVCESAPLDAGWQEQRTRALDEVAHAVPRARLMRWGGAIHDVPLQWPALVAGLIRAAVSDALTQHQPAP